jgi:PBS lyase HEAT-like repeat-containing protein
MTPRTVKACELLNHFNHQKLAFDLSISSDPAAIDESLKMAHSDASAQVRGQAIFWLGQSKDPRALEYLEAILKR